MHIAITLEHLSASVGGAEAYALTVARKLLGRGHRVTFCAADGQAPEGMTSLFGALDQAPSRLAALAPDLVVDWGLQVPADLHRLGGGTHAAFQRLILSASPAGERLVKGLLYRLLPRHRRQRRRQADLLSRPGVEVLAVSEFVARQVRETAPGLPPERVHVLHNGVDIERFRPGGPGRDEARRRLGLEPNAVAFLLVAHNLRLKGFPLLAEVFSALHRDCPQARLVLLGRHAPSRPAPWLVYAGASGTPEAIYQAADALVHPTLYDACANVVLEALACGLPVISSDRNGSAEVLTPDRDGIVLPVVGNHAEIVTQWQEAVRLLATRPERREALGNAARDRAETLTIDAYVDRFEALLHGLLTRRRRPS